MDNIYHRRLNIPTELFIPFYQKFDITKHTELKLKSDMVNKEFHDWLGDHGLEIHSSRFFHAPAGVTYKLHKDISFMNEINFVHSSCIKINIIYNSNAAKMSWYSLKPGAKPNVSVNHVGERLFVYDEHICDKIFETDVNGPADMVNGMIIHTMSNGDTPRSCYSMPLVKLGTHNRITWEEALVYLGDYIVD